MIPIIQSLQFDVHVLSERGQRESGHLEVLFRERDYYAAGRTRAPSDSLSEQGGGLNAVFGFEGSGKMGEALKPQFENKG